MSSFPATSRIGAVLAALAVALTLVACGQPQPPPAMPDEPPGDTAAAVLEAYRSFGGEIEELSSANPLLTVEVKGLQGSIPAYDLTGGNPPCPGFVSPAPSLIFTLADAASQVTATFAGNALSSLVVVAEGEEIVCDPSSPPALKPELTLDNPVAGRYGVWIGRADTDLSLDGTLVVKLGE